jgi:hypothetical protein
MNNWNAPAEPHENHTFFKFHPTDRNPVKDGRPQQAKRRPNHNLGANPTSSKQQFEMMCQDLLGFIETMNAKLLRCKEVASGTPTQIQNARNDYRLAARDVNRFIAGVDTTSGCTKYVERGSFYVEVVEWQGFIVAARFYGHPLLPPTTGGLEPFHSSSSYYSLYSPICS